MDVSSNDKASHDEQLEETQDDEKSVETASNSQFPDDSDLNMPPNEEPISFSADPGEINGEGDTDSEFSEPESPANVDDKNQKNDDGTSKGKGKAKKRKQRKKHDPTKRKKIRKLLTEDKLHLETLEAMKQEEERKKRLEEQAMRSQTQSLNYSNPPESKTPDLLRPSEIHTGSSFLASLLTGKGPVPQPLMSDSLPSLTSKLTTKQKQTPSSADDVICISSDSEDEVKTETSKPADTIDVSSDSSDDVICTGVMAEEEPEPEDVNNSGMHIEDAKNQRDNEGRVLVNVNRPTNEPEIFLAPQLASAVLPHQIGGIRFMFDNIVETLSHYQSNVGFGCILAHSMGLGKTLQVISFVEVFLRYTKARTVLIVVPVNTLMNWVSEFNMWLPPKSKCLDANPAQVWPRAFSLHILSDNHKTTEARGKVVSQWEDEGGVLLLGYEMYRLLTSGKSKRRRRRKNNARATESTVIDLEEEDKIAMLSSGIQASLSRPGPDLIICDEGHRIKNSHASISQTLKNVRTRRRIVLTGYPLQNNLLEYWCMVDFVRPNFLGTRNEFSNMFERPITNGQCADSTESDVRLMRFRSHVLHSLLKGFVQRRSHSVLSQTLPFKEEHVFMIRLSEWQKKLYNSFWTLKMSGTSGSWCSSNNPIKAFSVCCKIWNHPDVLYRIMQLRSEENNDIDPDLDLPDSMDASLSVKPKNQSKPLQNSVNGDTSTSASGAGPPSSSSTIIQSTGFNPFGDMDRAKRLNYDWAKDLMAGYSTGVLELSGKMVVLMQLIQATVSRGDRLLVFSQSLKTLTLIEEFLGERFVPKQSSDEPTRKWAKNDSYFRLDGNTNSTEREKLIKQFNSPDNKTIHLFLLSTRAGCLGINLIGANRVVVFDASWNPCHDAQAVCRVYRYGQMKTCHIYRLVCDQTMEKKIYERQITKQGMSDRVVDKLNPTQQYTKQDVLSLLEYSDVELPEVDFSEVDEEYADPVLRDICKMSGHWFTKKPFTHESLLLDCKDQRLTKAEQRAAEKGYQRDKLASSAYNYGRQSYSGFYGSPAPSNPAPPLNKSASSSSTFPSYTSQSHDSSRPIANVRPMQSIPFPQVQPNMASGPNSYYQKSGISVQKVVATTNIPLPLTNTQTNTTASGLPEKINAGEAICIIRGKKGTYIRTSMGRIFAVKLNDQTTRYTSPAADTRLTSSTSLNSPITSDMGNFHNDVTNTHQSPLSLTPSSSPWTDRLPGYSGSVHSHSATSSMKTPYRMNHPYNYSNPLYSNRSYPPMVPLQRPPPNHLDFNNGWSSLSANNLETDTRTIQTNSSFGHSMSTGALNLSSTTNQFPDFTSRSLGSSSNQLSLFPQSPANSNSPPNDLSAFLQLSANSNSPTNQTSGFLQSSADSNSLSNQMLGFLQSSADSNSPPNPMSGFLQSLTHSISPTNPMSGFLQSSANSNSPSNQMSGFLQSSTDPNSPNNQMSGFLQSSTNSNSPTNQMSTLAETFLNPSLATFSQSTFDHIPYNSHFGHESKDHPVTTYSNQMKPSYSAPSLTGLDQYNSSPMDLTNPFPPASSQSANISNHVNNVDFLI